jgi:hypothetical protein
MNMSSNRKGILHLAVTGTVPLQLEYRDPSPELRDATDQDKLSGDVHSPSDTTRGDIR